MGCMAAALLFATGGCSDDVDIYRGGTAQGSDCISFSIEEADVWVANGTRSDDASASSLPSPLNPEIIPLNNTDGDPLYIHRYIIAQMKDDTISDTRGSLVKDFKKITKIHLIGYSFEGEEFSIDDIKESPDYVTTLIEKSDNYWVDIDNNLKWEENKKFAFFAFASNNDDNTEELGLYLDDNHHPTVKYRNKTNLKDDTDILIAYAVADPAKDRNGIQLKMHHPLSSVQFITADDFSTCIISKLSLGTTSSSSGFENSGTLDLSYLMRSPRNALWQSIDGFVTEKFEIESSEILTPKEQIGGEESTLMIVPTELNQNINKVNLDLTLSAFDDNNKLQTIFETTTPISISYQCVPGHIMVYKISNSDVVTIEESNLEIDKIPTFTYGNGEIEAKNLIVASTIRVNGKTIPCPWTMSIEPYEETNDNWLNPQNPSETYGGETNKTTISLEAKPSTMLPQIETPHQTALRGNPIKTDCDLSMINGAINTSNCYIINAGGSYKFPIVYGNSIKDGVRNNKCGLSNKEKEYSSFIRHDGSLVTDPKVGFLSETGDFVAADANNSEAVLLWQDVKENEIIIDPSSLSIESEGDYNYIHFEANKEMMQPANALIAVRRNDTKEIMWSWHIWILDYDFEESETITLSDGSNYFKSLPFTLGYCPSPSAQYWPERKAKVTIKQIGGNKSKTIVITQQAFERDPDNNTVFYQWGSKDPFVAASNSNKTIDETGKEHDSCVFTEQISKGDYYKKYTASDDKFLFSLIKTDDITDTQNICYAIKNPTSFIYGGNWIGKNLLDMWDLSNSKQGETSTLTDKTIYDPSPAGYCVPPTSICIWGTSTYRSPFHSSSIREHRGAWLYSDSSDPESALIFFSANGRRNGEKMADCGSYCMYWTTGTGSNGNGQRLRIYDDNGWNIGKGSFASSTGCAIISVKEKE